MTVIFLLMSQLVDVKGFSALISLHGLSYKIFLFHNVLLNRLNLYHYPLSYENELELGQYNFSPYLISFLSYSNELYTYLMLVVVDISFKDEKSSIYLMLHKWMQDDECYIL